MDARRVLPFLLLVIYIINGVFANQNGRSRPNNIRHIRRISEYLVPPPLPRFPPDRVPRLANYQTTPQPGYFMQLMKWLNPFGSDSSPQLPPPPQFPPQPKASYPPKFIQPAPLPPTAYNGLPHVNYEKPPLPSSSVNDHSGYPAPIKAKSCNSCNKVPWMPIQHSGVPYSGDSGVPYSGDSYGPPPLEAPGGEYPGHEVPHDAYHAASHDVRATDFSVPDSYNPLPNLHVFPGAMPPLFKAGDFNYRVQVTPDKNSGYLDQPPPLIPGNDAPTGNDSFLNAPGPTFNGGHNGQSVYPGSSDHLGVGDVSQELEYTNPGASSFENFHPNHAAHDLSSSGTQVSHGHHVNPIPDKQGFDANKGSFGSINPSEISNHEEFYEVTGSSGAPGGFPDNTNQNGQNFPSSFGISGLDRIPNNYEDQHNDLSSSANVEGTRAPLHTLDGSSGKIGDSINFEESPLLDFTQEGESRTHSSSIPSTSNAFAGFESTEIAGTTVAPGNEIFGTRQGSASTESDLPVNYFETIGVTKEPKINNSETQDIKSIREQNVPSFDKTEDPWSDIFFTSIGTDRKPSENVLSTPYDDLAEEPLSDNINLDKTTEHRDGKRNKQVQVIIPYTSQYTPLPFHPSHKTNTDTGESNHDSYVGEESKNRIKVVSPPNSSHIFQPWTTAMFEDTTRKPVDTKANNSIDVHKLQKNIDNWTIQEYSKGTTVSTISPSSSNPYLFPSKKIPNEYFTTTKSIDHADSYNDNVKTFTLSGFSFNDEEYKESASNRMENSRVQIIKAEKSTESSTDAPTTSKDMWRGFPVGVSSVNRERVYIVTPQPSVTTSSSNSEYRQEKVLMEAERDRKESKETSQTDTKKSDTFESIEKAYQVLPQAVNNLAVASTGPESVPLWGIMEHEEFASPVDGEYDNNDTEPPTLYSRLSKELRARR